MPAAYLIFPARATGPAGSVARQRIQFYTEGMNQKPGIPHLSSQSAAGRLSRRAFLSRSGALLSAAALAQYCASAARQAGARGDDPLENARAAGLGDRPILVALNAGVTAPNPHNTQAWKFRILSSEEALLYVDETRLLPVTDPPARQIHMGQGCLLELTAVAASALERTAEIELFPEGYAPERDIGKKPVARIRLRPGGALDPLAAAIGRRHTVRSAYTGPALTPAEFQSLARATAPRAAQLAFTAAGAELDAHLDRHFAGFTLETMTRRTGEESRQWFRIGEREIFSKRDGISLRDNGVAGFQRWFIETFILSHEPESFFDPDGMAQFLETYKRNLYTARGQIQLITKGNAVRDWILSGRDYARLHLAATAAGLVMRPMSQLLQEFPEMTALREDYERFSGVRPPAKIQIVALLGRGDHDYYSPRRPLSAMVRES